MNREYQWVKYRQNFSHSTGDWEYALVYRKNLSTKYYDLNENLEDLGIPDDYSWSEHYRGMDSQKVTPSKVPTHIKEEEVKAMQSIIEVCKHKLNFLNGKINLDK